MGVDFRGLVWKRVRKITFFGLKAGRVAHLHQEFPGVSFTGFFGDMCY